MSFASEFKTVDLIIASEAETRGVDAFALSLIKAERQLRKCFTHLVYQFICFGPADVGALRNTLASNKRVYFEGIEKGFNALYPVTIEALVGANYDRLRERLNQAISHRNKIFHGQLTDHFLSREELVEFVSDIRAWCETLASQANESFGYDGLSRNSFQKSALPRLAQSLKVNMHSVADYETFIRDNMQR
ncbi:hypothetical protein [Gilvimarinus agarilyticus]|uniref:hypothetical protein n=1 Tax=Gilvimarinus agarilyticus TaxID=679259 RepID=UPI00059F2829|nr:hypothetical protein [Gilvimarinus agarilyticus]